MAFSFSGFQSLAYPRGSGHHLVPGDLEVLGHYRIELHHDIMGQCTSGPDPTAFDNSVQYQLFVGPKLKDGSRENPSLLESFPEVIRIGVDTLIPVQRVIGHLTRCHE